MDKKFFHKKKFMIAVLPAACAVILFILLFAKFGTGSGDNADFQKMLKNNSFVTDRNDTGNAKEAYDDVRASTVRLRIGNIYGEGSIWDISEDAITIVTNRHVVKDFEAFSEKDVNSNYVIFFTGEAARVSLLAISYDYDAAFLKVDVSELDPEKICSLRKVRNDDTVYDRLSKGDAVISIESSDTSCEGPDDDHLAEKPDTAGIADSFHEGTILDTGAFIEELQESMLYLDCYSEEGMSGSGIYDSYGNYIGMLTGGSEDGKTVAVPVTDIISFEKAGLAG